jgi:methyl-accepting chemotaxis protein
MESKETTYAGKSPEEVAESIKAIAKNIRDSSMQVRQTVKTLRESGGLQELTEAINMAVIAARDTAKDINDTARELQESGMIDQTRSAVEETASTTRDTVQRVREEAGKMSQSVKKTGENLQNEGEKPAGTA